MNRCDYARYYLLKWNKIESAVNKNKLECSGGIGCAKQNHLVDQAKQERSQCTDVSPVIDMRRIPYHANLGNNFGIAATYRRLRYQ